MKQTHTTYGLITGLATIIFGALMLAMKMDMDSGLQYVTYLIMLAGLVMNAMAYAKANDNYVTFGNVYGSCFKAVLIMSVLALVWGIVIIYAFPDLKDEVLSKMADKFEKDGTPEEQAEVAMNMTEKYWGVTMIFGSLIGTMFMGALLSLIAAAIPKKKGAMPEHMQP
jgi:tetrahydromethanopterin S-methyltransferase subunit B